jgi:hypothetical protein
MCGDGRIEGAELCDGNCPALGSCSDGSACTVDGLTGSAASCDAACAYTTIESCTDGDGCCAEGCTSVTDDDCSATCGNDTVEGSETCDGNCPADCNDNVACTADGSSGSAANCNLQCTHTTITSCVGGDGCCPSGCNANNDNNCNPVCGNGVVESGEECDGLSLPTATCDTSCQTICVWVIEYEIDSQVTLSEASVASANGDYDQSSVGSAVYMLTDVDGVPGDGPMAVLYGRSRTQFNLSVVGTTIATDVTATSGTPTNACPLNAGMMTGGVVTWGACDFVGSDWGSNAWTPAQQQVSSGMDEGCLPVRAVGNVQCSGGAFESTVCSAAGLSVGANPQDDTWDQPLGLTTFNFSGFAGGTDSSFTGGGTAYSGSPYYPDARDSPTPSIASTKTESPNNAASRLWRSTWSTNEVSRQCVPPPTGCP